MKYLYKYVPLDINNLSNIYNESIYFSNIDDFDDPTDSAFIVLTGGEAVDVKYHSLAQQKLYDFMEKPFPINKEPHQQFFNICRLLERALKEYVGVSCFSEYYLCQSCRFPIGLNPIMLSHYADKHSGLIIEYESNNQDNLEIKQVNYCDRYEHFNYVELLENFIPQYNSKELKINDKIIKPLLFKFKDWDYQIERRIFYQVKKSKPCSELGLKITRIFFGYRSEPYLRNTIKQILKDKNRDIEFYKLRLPVRHNEQQPIIIYNDDQGRQNCESECR